jgi:hypothetical protein
MELFGKVLVLPRYYKRDVVKTRQASHGLTETRQKGHWKIMLNQGGERKIHTLEMGGHVQMVKNDPEAQRKSSLSNCTWLENEFGSFNLEVLKFLMHFREPGSSLDLPWEKRELGFHKISLVKIFLIRSPSLPAPYLPRPDSK